MDTEPAFPAALLEFKFDIRGSKQQLMTAFERLEELPPSTKDRIRFRVWSHLNELPESGMDEPDNDLDAYVAFSCILSAFVLAPILAFVWSSDQTWLLRTAAIFVAELLVVLVLLVVSLWGIGRFTENDTLYSALCLLTAALLVLAIRSLPQWLPTTMPWLIDGLQAGLWGAVILPFTIPFLQIASPLIHRWHRRDWSLRPEANVVAHLLDALQQFECLVQLERQRGEEILKTISVEKQRRERLAEILGQGNIVNSSQSTVVTKSDEGEEREIYELWVKRSDGKSDLVFTEERLLNRHSDEKWQNLRKRITRSIENAALYIDRGLPAKLRVGPAEIDEWLQLELTSRAQALKVWARLIVLPSTHERAHLMNQIATTIEHAAEGNWGALVKAEIHRDPGLRQRLWMNFRKLLVGLIPLVIVLVSPLLGVNLPQPVRDSLFAFAIPWLLLQLLQLAVPKAGEQLSSSKVIGEMLPKF